MFFKNKISVNIQWLRNEIDSLMHNNILLNIRESFNT